jgi:hypothetical protein
LAPLLHGNQAGGARLGKMARRPTYLPLSMFHPLTRADAPIGLLCTAAAASPLAVLYQGGDWHTAALSACVVLGTPGAAIEAMVGLARLMMWIEKGGN